MPFGRINSLRLPFTLINPTVKNTMFPVNNVTDNATAVAQSWRLLPAFTVAYFQQFTNYESEYQVIELHLEEEEPFPRRR